MLARAAFERECKKKDVETTDYDGPVYLGYGESAYKFAWRDRNGKGTIFVAVF